MNQTLTPDTCAAAPEATEVAERSNAGLVAELGEFRSALRAVLPHAGAYREFPDLAAVLVEAGAAWATDRFVVAADTFAVLRSSGALRVFLSTEEARSLLARHRGAGTVQLSVGDGVLFVGTERGGLTEHPTARLDDPDRHPVQLLRRSLWDRNWAKEPHRFDDAVPMDGERLARFTKAARIVDGRRDSVRLEYTVDDGLFAQPGPIRVTVGEHFRALMMPSRH